MSGNKELDGQLTHLGMIASQLPLDPHCTKLIMLGYATGCLRETIVMGECIIKFRFCIEFFFSLKRLFLFFV